MLPAAGAEDQQEHRTDLWSAYTAEVAFLPLRQAIRIVKSESLDSKCRTSLHFWKVSAAHSGRVPSAKYELTGILNSGNLGKMIGGTIRNGLRSLQQAAGGTMRNFGTRGKICTAGPIPLSVPLESGTFQNLPRFLGSLQII